MKRDLAMPRGLRALVGGLAFVVLLVLAAPFDAAPLNGGLMPATTPDTHRSFAVEAASTDAAVVEAAYRSTSSVRVAAAPVADRAEETGRSAPGHVAQANPPSLSIDRGGPERDLRDLSARLRPFRPGSPVPLQSIPYRVGQVDTFWVADQVNSSYVLIAAEIGYVSPHAYFYVERGIDVNQAMFEQSAEVFEREVLPLVLRHFGFDEASLGGQRITILHAHIPGGVAGYFSTIDEYPKTVNPFSNERVMIYISTDAAPFGTREYTATLAHELQHLFHSLASPGEEAWINEGASELAMDLVEGRQESPKLAFERRPDTQLNAWVQGSSSLVHYGASYAFLKYLSERFGLDAVSELVHIRNSGIAGVEQLLSRRAPGLSFDGLFADWAVANYLDDTSVSEGRFGYRDLDIHASAEKVTSVPWRRRANVSQYAAEYYELPSIDGRVTLRFYGEPQTRLLPNGRRPGYYQWWSGRADGMDSTMTRELDLTGVTKATLRFRTWFDIEKDFDYAYVEVSRDGGRTWNTLRGRHNTMSNPNGASFGYGYTGHSGMGDQAGWVWEEIDLGSYVGSRLLLRFEYVTDDAVSGPGFAIDSISVPEIGWRQSADDDSGWTYDGFVRTGNSVAQRFAVRLVRVGPGEPEVISLALDEQQESEYQFLSSAAERYTLVVAATADWTLEAATFEISLEQSID